MKRFLVLAASILATFMSPPALAQASHPEDASFAAAREAFLKSDRARLTRALEGLKSHPLLPWAQYFQLSLRLRDGDDSAIPAFLERQANSFLAEKLRGEWIKFLVERQDWSRARIEFALLQRPEADAQCRGIEIRWHLNEPEAAADARSLLNQPAPLPESCLAPFGRLAARGELPAPLLWQRLGRQMATNRPKEIRALADWLPDSEAPTPKNLDTLLNHPAQFIARLPDNFAENPRQRGQIGLAVLRMARSDVRVAAARWQDIEAKFPALERGFIWGRLALAASLAHQAEATAWFNQAETLGATFDEEQHEWRMRMALRGGQWPAVTRAAAGLPGALASKPEWIYWQARALAAQGRPEAAQALHARIADQPNFYGILATEALGTRYALPTRAAAPSAEEMISIATVPGLTRGLALIRLDMRNEGVREWNWGLQGLSDRQLLAAAEYARRNETIDRAINTADRTKSEHDYGQRYPTPYLAQVEPRIRDVGLDAAWVYGLMRQESRFIMDAKSSAGAKGLMQLMPATAKWVARKIGMDHYHPGKVTDMDTNVTLGTNYMRMVLDGLDDHPVLASAAYNAGPGRARKWRAERTLEGAIYAETIPFNETRDYVKKVMANAMHYALLMNGNSPSLTARLGTIRPRGFGDGTAEDLP